MKSEINSKKSIRNDIILIVGILVIAIIGIVYLFCFRESGDTVKVSIDGKTYGTYSLSENIEKDILTGKNNEHHNRLVIKDGKAYMEFANCPDGICVDHSKIFRNGESIVCLPHKVVISVITQEKTDNPDIIV